MAVSGTSSDFQYAGDGVTVTFTVPFMVFVPADVVVTLFDTVAQAQVAPGPVLNGAGIYDYSFAGSFDAEIGEYVSGNQITFNNAPPATLIVNGVRSVPATQGRVFLDYTKFPAKRVEGALDRLTLICQQLIRLLGRCLQLPPTGLAVVSPVLPVPVADSALTWNATGTAIVNRVFQPATDIVSATPEDVSAATSNTMMITPLAQAQLVRSFKLCQFNLSR